MGVQRGTWLHTHIVLEHTQRADAALPPANFAFHVRSQPVGANNHEHAHVAGCKGSSRHQTSSQGAPTRARAYRNSLQRTLYTSFSSCSCADGATACNTTPMHTIVTVHHTHTTPHTAVEHNEKPTSKQDTQNTKHKNKKQRHTRTQLSTNSHRQSDVPESAVRRWTCTAVCPTRH